MRGKPFCGARPRRHVAGAALLACLLLAGCGPAAEAAQAAGTPTVPVSASSETPPKNTAPLLQCQYYERDSFLKGEAAAPAYTAEGRLVAGMVPHHLVAADMLSGFFALAAAQPEGYDTVVLLSTSHYAKQCAGAVVTAAAGWDTPFGPVAADGALIETLMADGTLAAAEDAEALERDHGVAGLVPYVRRHLPGARLVALLVANAVEAERLAALQNLLAQACAGGRVLLVASVDCSHYLPPAQAALRDGETMAAIEGFDTAAIARFTDANIDSPQAVAAFLSVVQAAGGSLVPLGHSSAAEKLPTGQAHLVADEGNTTYLVYGGVGGQPVG